MVACFVKVQSIRISGISAQLGSCADRRAQAGQPTRYSAGLLDAP